VRPIAFRGTTLFAGISRPLSPTARHAGDRRPR